MDFIRFMHWELSCWLCMHLAPALVCLMSLVCATLIASVYLDVALCKNGAPFFLRELHGHGLVAQSFCRTGAAKGGTIWKVVQVATIQASHIYKKTNHSPAGADCQICV